MTRILVVAVILAQAFDVVTWMAMPRAAEVNPLAQGLHSSSAWLLKSALVLLVFVLDEVVRIAPPPKYPVVAVVGRQAAELVVVLAIAAGCIGAGSNLAVITYVAAAETPRSAPEPAPIASEATGIEQGQLEPAAPARIPAPRLVRHEAPDIPRGTSGGNPSEHCLDRRSLPATELRPQDIDDASGVVAAGIPEVVRPTPFAVAAAGGTIDIWSADAAVPDRAVEPLKGVRDATVIGVLLHLQPELVRGDPGAALAIEETGCPSDLDIHAPIVADHVPPRNVIGTVRGTASWYAATGLVAAAGPELRRALGRHWRGRVVRVVARGRVVTVRLTDWCQCYAGTAGERLIDLGDQAFVRLAPLSTGLLSVEVSAVRRIRIQPPATDR